MKIDDKEFESYLLDNEYTIKRRFSFLNNTIPEFIYIEKINENKYKSINLMTKIQESNINSLNEIKELNDKYFYLSLIDVMCLWCVIKYKGSLPSGNNVDFYEFTTYIEKHGLKFNYIECKSINL